MLFRLEPVPYHRGATPIPAKFRWIEVLAVVPHAIERGTEGTVIHHLFLCRTDTGLHRIEDRLIWGAIEQGQYREARRSAARSGG